MRNEDGGPDPGRVALGSLGGRILWREQAQSDCHEVFVKFFFFFNFFICVCLFSVHMSTVPHESRRGLQTPWR